MARLGTCCLFLSLLSSCILLCPVTSSAQGNLRLYVGNSRGDYVDVVDMNSFKVVGDIKAGDSVHGVCLEPGGRRLFYTLESDHTLRIVDHATRTSTGVVKLSGKPNQCAVTPDGRFVTVP